MVKEHIKYQAIFFDFDGVILDSLHVKTEAFAEMFRKYGPETERAVIDHHQANGGISRFHKIKHYYENILKKSITQEELQELGDKFSKLVLQKVLNSPYIPGVLETLQKLKKNNVPCFVISGTPEEEINFIVEKKELNPFFLEVHGSPKEKQTALSDIIDRYKLTPEACLFIGDALTDYNAACKTGIKFLGIVKKGKSTPFPENTWINSSFKLDI